MVLLNQLYPPFGFSFGAREHSLGTFFGDVLRKCVFAFGIMFYNDFARFASCGAGLARTLARTVYVFVSVLLLIGF